MARMDTLPHHTGIVPVMEPLNPFAREPEMSNYGIPVGAMANQPFFFNPWEWARDPRIDVDSPGVVIFGKKDHGKTALAKLIAYYLSMLALYPNDPNSPLMRIWLDDSKAGEYAKLARSRPSADGGYCEPIVVREAGLNPLSDFMKISEMLVITSQILTHISNDGPLGRHETNVLIAGFEALGMRKISPSLHELSSVINLQNALDKPHLWEGSDERAHIPDLEWANNCREVGARLTNLLHGPTGGLFSPRTDASLMHKIETHQVINCDYEGADEVVKRLWAFIFWTYKRQFKFDVNVHDESYGLLKYIEFAEPLSDMMKLIRQDQKLVLLLTHRIHDYARLPDPVGAIAKSIIKDTPIWFVGRLEREDVEDLAVIRPMSEYTKQRIQHLPPGSFMAFLGAQFPPFEFKVLLNARARQICFSNDQLRKMTGKEVR